MTRRYRQFTKASDVTVIDAETGEIAGHEQAYDANQHRDIVARGNRKTSPTARASKRRSHNNN